MSFDSTLSHWGDHPCEAVVLYRAPHATECTRLIQYGLPRTFDSLDQVPLTGGYLIAPFTVTAETPVVWIEPDEWLRVKLPLPPALPTTACVHPIDEAGERAAYHRAFAQTSRRLSQNEVQKVVLSRRLELRFEAVDEGQGDFATDETEAANWQKGWLQAVSYFLQACHYRPNSFVSLWWTRATGAWLVATPEPLLEKHHHTWATVALAGTVPWNDRALTLKEWSDKNREEQAIVARFIKDQLTDVVTDLQASQTYSLHTGNLQHLCTDFHFGLPSPEAALQVLQRLHPTPAVCGFPREAARQAILTDEDSPRRYYAGFSGPFYWQDETHLYVSLRCMAFSSSAACLYAGGGIMPESIEADEWDETQRKLRTMACLLGYETCI